MTTATAPTPTVTRIPILLNGKWIASTTQRFGDVFNPSSGQVIAQVPLCTAAEVDTVVKAAAEAGPAWAAVPVVERVRVLFKLRHDPRVGRFGWVLLTGICMVQDRRGTTHRSEWVARIVTTGCTRRPGRRESSGLCRGRRPGEPRRRTGLVGRYCRTQHNNRAEWS